MDAGAAEAVVERHPQRVALVRKVRRPAAVCETGGEVVAVRARAAGVVLSGRDAQRNVPGLGEVYIRSAVWDFDLIGVGAGLRVKGDGVVVGRQVPGGDALRDQGVHLESLAIVESMDEKTGEIVFR